MQFQWKILFGLTLFLLWVCSCSSDKVTQPDPLVVDARIVIAGGQTFTGSQVVPLTIVAGDADIDSVQVFNVATPDKGDGEWFVMAGDSLVVPAWDLGSGEGLKSVGARFAAQGYSVSEAVTDDIVLDLTPPDIPPVVVFPASGATSVPSAAALDWTPAQDSLCPEDEISYTVYLGDSEQNEEAVWSGYGTGALLGDLGRTTTWYWRLVSTDAAGNSDAGVRGSFTTWDVDLPEFKLLPAGTFMMGSPDTELGRYSDENLHQVTLTRPFYMGSTNVSLGQFIELLNAALDQGLATIDEEGVYDNLSGTQEKILDFSTRSNFDYVGGGHVGTHWPNDRICQDVSWFGAAALCDWLNNQAGFISLYDRNDGWRCNGGDVYGAVGFRLATEAEWEYGCRAGSTTAFANGDITGIECWDPVLDEIGWYCGNYGAFPFLPAMKISNAWGLYDMQGGLNDWCYDKYEQYPLANLVDPVFDDTGLGRVVRGSKGLFPGHSRVCRSAARGAWEPERIFESFSLRLVLGYGAFLDRSWEAGFNNPGQPQRAIH